MRGLSDGSHQSLSGLRVFQAGLDLSMAPGNLGRTEIHGSFMTCQVAGLGHQERVMGLISSGFHNRDLLL